MRPLRFAALPLLVLLSACTLLQPSAPPPPPVDPGAERAERRARFEERLVVLPGAQVSRQGSDVTLAYPEEILFAAASALPFPGGSELLDPLAELIKALPDAGWQGTVRAATGLSAEHDQALAAKRAELLARYFRQRGLPEGVPVLRAAAGAGAPLELHAQPASPASSAAAKP